MFASNPSPSSSSSTSSLADSLIRQPPPHPPAPSPPPRRLRPRPRVRRRAPRDRLGLLPPRRRPRPPLERRPLRRRPRRAPLQLRRGPDAPLRVRIGVYAVLMFCVAVECTRRRRVAENTAEITEEGSVRWERSSSGSGSDESEDYGVEESLDYNAASFVKNLESANTMFLFIWWILGFYWVTAGRESLTTDSPQLYWITITFLALDVVFVVICVAVASLIGIAVCFCLPCIIDILYVVTDQEGATKEEIDHLPKYKFRKISDYEKVKGEIQVSFGGIMTECDTDAPTEHALSQEDAECCICLCSYDDGTELRELPCLHHFHCTCIDKWLQINATCPLCKFNILKSADQSSSEGCMKNACKIVL